MPKSRVVVEPPVEQNRVALRRRRDRPVDLRREEVDPALRQPVLAVGVQFRVRVETGDRRRHAGRMTRPVDAERTDAELDARSRRLDEVVDAGDHPVDVIAAPVVAREAAAGRYVGVVGGRVGELRPVRVRVEVVVEVDSVNVVPVPRSDNVISLVVGTCRFW